MRSPRFVALFLLACCVFGGLRVAALVPAELAGLELHHEEFRLTRPQGETLEVTPARWFLLPFQFGDFDLRMDLDLAPGVEVDVLLRLVEPRRFGQELLPFQGRFTTLRLSTEGDGPGWRTREQALFGPRGNGVGLAPGYPATISIEARGTTLRANVGGRWQPTVEAADRRGMIAIIARGGPALLHSFVVEPKGGGGGSARLPYAWLPYVWSPYLWAGLGLLTGALLVTLARRRGEPARWYVPAGIVVALFAWWSRRLGDLDQALPPMSAMALLLLAQLLLAMATMRTLRRSVAALMLAGCALATWQADRLMRHDDAAVDAAFGPDAGSAISEALAQMVRGPGGLHVVGGSEPVVFLLGGQLLYDRGEPGEHLELLLERELRVATQRRIDVPCLPTVDGHARQQWELFERFYTGYRPKVIVLGVPRDEAAIDPTTDAPRSDATRLREVVERARAHAAATGARLVLLADDGLRPVLRAVLDLAARDGAELVVIEADDDPTTIARKLARCIAPMLP
jgi:hypothetical protein